MQPRFDRPERHIERDGDVLERRLGKKTQFDDFPVPLRKPGNGLSNSFGLFGLLRTVRRVGDHGSRLRGDRGKLNRGEEPLPPMNGFQIAMAQHAMEPGRKLAATVETPDGFPGFEQCFLRNVLRELRFAAERAG